MRLDYQVDYGFTFTRRMTLDYPLHAQDTVEIGFMLRGTCRVRCGDICKVVEAGDVFVIFPNQLHVYDCSRRVEAILLIVPVKSYLSEYYNILKDQVPENPILRNGEWDSSIKTILLNAFSDYGTASDTVMHGYLTVIFGKLLAFLKLIPRHNGSQEVLHCVLEYLNAHYRENLTRRDIARAAGYNESYISHLFSQIMGTSLPEYIHSMRIDDARQMLKETDLPVSQISAELGFASIRNFNRVFLKQTGMTPRQYRSSERQNNKDAARV